MIEFEGVGVLRDPMMIAAFEGWNDAADAATCPQPPPARKAEPGDALPVGEAA